MQVLFCGPEKTLLFQCTVIPVCTSNRTINTQEVTRFDLQWGIVGAVVTCYYNVHLTSRVVLQLPPAKQEVASVHLAIGLTLIALLSLTSCVLVAIIYGCHDCTSFIKRRCHRSKKHLPRAMWLRHWRWRPCQHDYNYNRPVCVMFWPKTSRWIYCTIINI